MSTDHLRHPQTPLSSSPSRSQLSRRYWPWSPYNHRSSLSSVSVHSTGGTVQGSSSASSSWDPRAVSSTASPASTMWSLNNALARGTPTTTPIPLSQDEPTRQWSFTAFEWVVRDVHKLRDFIESDQPTTTTGEGAGEDTNATTFDVLNESPMLGDGKFKLEIARVHHSQESPQDAAPVQTPSLALYVTSDYELCASMLAAIKCQDDRAGERGARANWAWEYWQYDWAFRQENEVWECPLPPLSSLLENPRIRETDSFVICVQIHTPVGPFYPQHPSAYYVPRDLLDGLEALLDNPNTGDVQFVCLERMPLDQRQSQPESPSHTATQHSRRSSSSASSHSTFHSQTVARKRVIYAHSDILKRRAEYFNTMLSSAFSETTGLGGRKVYTVIVEEGDFITIYWLLKWVYANWLLFKEEDDVRAAVEGAGAGWSAKWLSTSGVAGEWDWKTFSKSGIVDELSVSGRDDVRSVASAESSRSTGALEAQGLSGTSASGGVAQATPTPGSSIRHRVASTTTGRNPQTNTTSTSRSTQTTSTSSRRPVGPGASMSISVPNSTSPPSRTKPVPIPASSSRYPLSPRNQRQGSHSPAATLAPDPHVHPTTPAPPASALCMYQIAHRYAIPALASLALEHMMSTITPQTSFPLLLATTMFDELHSLAEDYVVDKWDEVSVSEEFERCCEEISSGEWGSDGGKTLMTLFRRLRSPSALSYTRG